MKRGKVAGVILTVFVILLFGGCGTTDKVVKILDKAIESMNDASVRWEDVLTETREKLIEAGQTTVANEVSNVLTKATQDLSGGGMCFIDFIRSKLADDLRRIRARFLNEKIVLKPHFCTPSPHNVDYAMYHAGRLNTIDISGFNLDFFSNNIKAYVVDMAGNKSEVTQHLGHPGEYLLTLNLGSKGVEITRNSNKIVFETSGNTYTLNVIQPQAQVARFTPQTIGFCGLDHRFGHIG